MKVRHVPQVIFHEEQLALRVVEIFSLEIVFYLIVRDYITVHFLVTVSHIDLSVIYLPF